MRRSPFVISQELKETLCTYLETAYRISHQAIVYERAELLRGHGVVSQSPYIETTPSFKLGNTIGNIKLPQFPSELKDFAETGLPMGNKPLYLHQEEALLSAWDHSTGQPRDLVVASGTGSGKTEIFYLIILSDILREARTWFAPTREQTDMGTWRRNEWLHRRRHERRPEAIRAIILYPMNALVNDQLRRLRRMLATDAAIQWQLENLAGNLVYFGRYTSQTMLPGTWETQAKRHRLEEYLGSIRAGWEDLGDDLRAQGYWPRPQGPEMLFRWNMQMAPPDILLTNYSMLEYMLVRPIEAPIFNATRDWLSRSSDNCLTLVLDEAHVYSGARGTEVAYLIRRLYERLGVGPEQIRCIATSASLGNTPEELERVRNFVSNLFDHPQSRFTVIQAQIKTTDEELPSPTPSEMEAFARFQSKLNSAVNENDEQEAVSTLLSQLELPQEGINHIQALFNGLEHHPRIKALRDITARNATVLDEVADLVWDQLDDTETRERATAGLLAAGAIARADGESLSDIPPLLPSRMHLMFRGIPGLWACIDPNCTLVDDGYPDRPCGKLYVEPRIWCDCGARVVELLSCRICGLLIGGGIEETHSNSRRIWPYEDDLESGIGQYERYSLFALEDPGVDWRGQQEWVQVWRSVFTTAIENEENNDARIVWEPPRDQNTDRIPIGSPCPRCGARPSGQGRNALEPFRTTGAQTFSALIEHSFRLQGPRFFPEAELGLDEEDFDWFNPPETNRVGQYPTYNPNLGRKALTFSDSRQNAARLAGDITYLHFRDLFRQLILSVLSDEKQEQPIEVSRLVEQILSAAVERGIDPTFGEVENFWLRWKSDRSGLRRLSEQYLDTYLRREIADRQVGVEALGLARWVVPQIDADRIPPLAPFNRLETVAILYASLRILAGENVIVPRTLDPLDWPQELVEWYYMKVITLPANRQDNSFVWDSGRNNRLTRYLNAVLRAGNHPLTLISEIMETLWSQYYRNRLAKPVAGNRPGFGIPITQFALASIPNEVYVCQACKYISAETIYGVCLRCHQTCERLPLDEAIAGQSNYYRRLSSFADDPDLPDPFPLRVLEHTAQISPEEAAKRERRFQDRFLPETSDNPEDPVQHGVDVLSVTTTMEMGIDIGDLTVVGLHNTPPTVANYQQRAGRAGRRSDGIAEVITFGRHRSHDQYYYDRVAEMVTGDVRIPTLHMDNRVIARRHINALILQGFFEYLRFGSSDTTLFEAFGQVRGLLAESETRLTQLRDYIHSGMGDGNLIESIQDILGKSGIALDEAKSWAVSLPESIRDVASIVPEETLLLNLLIEKGILPRYAFPVDVVALWLNRPSRWNQGEEVQRDLSIALSEYAPGSEIVIDGRIYGSVGLYTPFEDQPDYGPSGWYYKCDDCHYARFSPRESSPTSPNWEHCPICRAPVGINPRNQIMPAVEPKGFRTDWRTEQKYRGGGQERAGFASPAQLVAGESAEYGLLFLDERLYVHHRTGDLYVINQGPPTEGPSGFLICPRCGRNIENSNSPHRDPSTNRACHGGTDAQRSVLLHQFNTDISLFGVNLSSQLDASPTIPGGRSVWLSVGTAIRQGAAAHLQVDPEELAMGIRPWIDPANRLLAEIYLYDTLPNGAGYAREIAQEVPNVLLRAIALVESCPTKCQTACYRCLLEYGNQPFHGLLDRHLAYDVLNYILTGTQPYLSSEVADIALGYLRAFTRDIEFEIIDVPGSEVPVALLRDPQENRSIVVIPRHTLSVSDLLTDSFNLGISAHPVFVSHFDLTRRPFWVWDNLLPILMGRSDLTDISSI